MSSYKDLLTPNSYTIFQKDAHWIDPQSLENATPTVGLMPFGKLFKGCDGTAQLQDFAVPAGLVLQPFHSILHGGEHNEEPIVTYGGDIDSDKMDELLDMVRIKIKNNSTRKNHKSKAQN